MIRAIPAEAGVYVLSEGPRWNGDSGELSWVDIERGSVLTAPIERRSGSAPTVGPVSTVSLGGTVGFAVPTAAGRFLVGLGRSLALARSSGEVESSAPLAPEGTRFNDGGIDPQGRLVAGTLTLDGAGHDNLLLRLETDGSVTTLDADLGLSNGIAWSPDGAWMYSIDTDARTVYRRSYASGAVGPREVFVVVAEDGWPDGMSVDAEGNLWIAIWGAGGVRVFAPDGSPHPEYGIEIDAPYCSSVAFAGAALDTLVVTSSSRDHDAGERATWPNAGGLFIAAAPVRGLPATAWAGAPLPRSSAAEPA